MSLTSFERDLARDLKMILNNPKLKVADIQEWSTSKDAVLKALLPEKEVYVEVGSIHCAVLKTADKRPK